MSLVIHPSLTSALAETRSSVPCALASHCFLGSVPQGEKFMQVLIIYSRNIDNLYGLGVLHVYTILNIMDAMQRLIKSVTHSSQNSLNVKK